MGLASDGSRWKVLTDLQDMEDGKGGMDFKFTSTKDGITAIQMDTKTRGLSREMIAATFPQMRKAIEEVLAVITNCLPEPRKELSQYAPRIIAIKIDPEKIGEVIGPGGKVIRGMCEEYDVQIDVQDDGTVTITSTNMEAAKRAEKAGARLVTGKTCHGVKDGIVIADGMEITAKVIVGADGPLSKIGKDAGLARSTDLCPAVTVQIKGDVDPTPEMLAAR